MAVGSADKDLFSGDTRFLGNCLAVFLCILMGCIEHIHSEHQHSFLSGSYCDTGGRDLIHHLLGDPLGIVTISAQRLGGTGSNVDLAKACLQSSGFLRTATCAQAQHHSKNNHDQNAFFHICPSFL